MSEFHVVQITFIVLGFGFVPEGFLCVKLNSGRDIPYGRRMMGTYRTHGGCG